MDTEIDAVAFSTLPITGAGLTDKYQSIPAAKAGDREKIEVLARKNSAHRAAQVALKFGSTWDLYFDSEGSDFVFLVMDVDPRNTGAFEKGLKTKGFSRLEVAEA